MHTPEGFNPGHTPPATLPDETLVFAFRDDKLLVGGSDNAPVVPHSSALEALGLHGDRHYLGELEGVGCVAVSLPPDAAEPDGWRYAGLRSLFFRLPDALLAIAARASAKSSALSASRESTSVSTPTTSSSPFFSLPSACARF